MAKEYERTINENRQTNKQNKETKKRIQAQRSIRKLSTSLLTKEIQIKKIIIFTHKVSFFPKLRDPVVGSGEGKHHCKLF